MKIFTKNEYSELKSMVVGNIDFANWPVGDIYFDAMMNSSTYEGTIKKGPIPKEIKDVAKKDLDILAEKLIENNLPLHINYLSCDIDPTCNTYSALKKIIEEGISFDFISFEHDEYFRKNCTNDTNDYHALAIDFLKKNNYKIAIDNIYPKNKPEKLFETWFINNSIIFDEIRYTEWKKLNL